MNVERILKLADHIEGLAENEFDQGCWTIGDDHGCETPGCIAGHAVHMFDRSRYAEIIYRELAISNYPIPDRLMWNRAAAELLGLHPIGRAAYELFAAGPDIPPCDVEGFWIGPSTTDAAACLRRLVTTGEVKWIRE